MHSVWVLSNKADKIESVRLCKNAEICRFDFASRNASFTEDRAEAGVRILEVKTGIAFERSYYVHVDVIVIDSKVDGMLQIFLIEAPMQKCNLRNLNRTPLV